MYGNDIMPVKFNENIRRLQVIGYKFLGNITCLLRTKTEVRLTVLVKNA